MVQGQENEGTSFAVEDAHLVRYAPDVGHQVSQGEHDTLWRTRCAGGVDNYSRILFPSAPGGGFGSTFSALGYVSLLVIVDAKHVHLCLGQGNGLLHY